MKRIPKLDCETCEGRTHSVFADLCGNELGALNHNKVCNTYKKGQIVFYEGNMPMGLYCINQGKIKVFKTGRGGKEQIVRLAKDGDVLGYRSLIGNEPYTATAEALEDSTICFTDRKMFEQLLQTDPALPKNFMELLCQELRDAENFLQSMAQKTVRERLAEVILILRKKYGTHPTQENRLNVELSREDIANLVGTATETVIRLLSDFKDEKIVNLEGRVLHILNPVKLMAIAKVDD